MFLSGFRSRSARSLLAVALGLGALTLPSVALALPQPTNYGNNSRTGWYANQKALTPDYVASPSFGPIFATKVDATVMSQPLVSNGRLIVTTVANSVYALDPVTGAIKWRRNFGVGFDAGLRPVMCSDLKPFAGGLGTPVIDPSGSGTVYTTVKVGAGTKYPYGSIVLHAISVATGSERSGFPVVLGGRADNQPSVNFNSVYQLQRPGLMLQDGAVYIASGGMCDMGDYHGWVFRVTTRGKTTARWVGVPAGRRGAGIWQAGSGVASDGPGSLLVTTGNGVGAGASPGPDPTPSKQPPAGLGQSVVRLTLQRDGKLKATDFFAPADAEFLDQVDGDFASGGPVILPASFGTPKVPRVLAVIGKAGVLYTLDRDTLGGFKMGPDGSNAVVHMGPQRNGVWGKPTVFGGSGGLLFATSYGRLDVYRRLVTDDGRPSFSLCAATSSEPIGLGSSSPVVTSNGALDGTAIAWAVTMPYRDGNGAQLRAYRGSPTCGQELKSFRSWGLGSGARYAPPGVGDGRIYVGTNDSRVLGFGRPAPEPLLATGADLGDAVVGSPIQRAVTLTANGAQRVESVTLEGGGPFSIATPTPGLPAQIASGGTVSVPIAFDPMVPGPRGATLRVVTSLGEVRVSLNGRGRSPEPYARLSTSLIAFGSIPYQTLGFEPLTITNEGSKPLVISAFDVTQLSGREVELFNYRPLPMTIAPGGSRTVEVRYWAATFGPYTGELQLTTNGAEPAANRTVGFTGFGARIGDLEIVPSGVIDFGSVKLGRTVTRDVAFRNLGDMPLVLNKYKPPAAGPFSLSKELDEGSRLEGTAVVNLKLSFSPTAVGASTRNWYVTATDGLGPRVIMIKGTGIR